MTDAGPAPSWTAGAVARRVGVSPSTLRSWSRRHGLSATGHQRGAHRRYTDHDVAVLETMQRLVSRGVVAAAAADMATASSVPDLPEAMPAPPVGSPGRPITGPLVRAALRYDAGTMLDALATRLAVDGVAALWEGSCVPALRSVGRRSATDEACIGSVHLLSWCLTTALHSHTATLGPRRPGASRRVLLACTDGERHQLGLDALHAELAERGVAATMLGASVPATSVVAAAGARAADAVVLWSQAARTARPGILRTLLPVSDVVVAAGPGWNGARLPSGVVHATSLGGATASVLTPDRRRPVGTTSR